MKQKYTLYICILFFVAFSEGIFSQKLELRVASKDSLENDILQEIDFKKTHFKNSSVKKEIDVISEKLKQIGYFSNSLESLVRKDSTYTALFLLGEKIKEAIISLPYNVVKWDVLEFSIKKNKVNIPVNKILNFLASISAELDLQGKSFSEVKLKNIRLKGDLLFAELHVLPSRGRTIDKVVIKGYELFPKSHIKHYFNLRKRTVFSKQRMREISKATKLLNFVSEIKPPEVLFSKDSTMLYMYLKKNRINTFDGLLSFASKKNGKGLAFNGHLDLQLNNILHTGERFSLLFKANGEENNDFRISTRVPYIFNTVFTPKISFNIYKRDSSFLNTKFYSGISYNINPKASIGLTYTSETSKSNLKNLTDKIISNFDNNFWGIQFSYSIPKNDVFLNNLFHLSVNPSLGKRTAINQSSNQLKIDFETSYLFNLNQRNSIYIRNKTGYLGSNSFLENELYRIGGVNSIRGYNEQDIFTSKFTYFNIEYRYLTSSTSYIYSISDIGGYVKKNLKNEKLLGLGLGYLFHINNSQISLTYTLAKLDYLSNSKIGIKLVNSF